MSARELRHMSGRNAVHLLDLNQMPPLEDVIALYQHEPETSHVRARSPPPPPPAAIDVETIDDEVVISSPRRFHEARNKARHSNHRGVTAVDQDQDQLHQGERAPRLTPNSNRKRRRVPTNMDYIDLEGLENAKRAKRPEPSQSMKLPPPKEPTFNCPICMEQIREPTSTKCGHIFCRICITTATIAQSKCPTCRTKISVKNTIRVYLPGTC